MPEQSAPMPSTDQAQRTPVEPIEVLAVRAWQLGRFHPLTRGKDSKHPLLQPKVLIERGDDVAPRVLLVCPSRRCTYVQSWIPEPALHAFRTGATP